MKSGACRLPAVAVEVDKPAKSGFCRLCGEAMLPLGPPFRAAARPSAAVPSGIGSVLARTPAYRAIRARGRNPPRDRCFTVVTRERMPTRRQGDAPKHETNGRRMEHPSRDFCDDLAGEYDLIFGDWDGEVERQGKTLDALLGRGWGREAFPFSAGRAALAPRP